MDDELDINNNEIDEEIIEIAKDNDIEIEEAEEVRDLADELGIDTDEALEIWQDL